MKSRTTQRAKAVLLFNLLSSLITLFSGCSSPLIYNSVWQAKPVTIDGKAKEWKIPLDYYDPKTKLNFSISNDASNLYFCIRATEDETQKGIVHTGLQIWIDTTGGKKEELGIQFPVIQKRDLSSGSSSDEHASSGESAGYSLQHHYAGTPKEGKLTGFHNAMEGLVEMPNIYGLNVCLNWDSNNIMIYEVCIPFKTFYKPTLTASDSAKTLGVSFIVTVTPKAEHNGGGHSGGGGGSGGGGMGGGMHGGGGGRGGGGHGGGGESSGPETLTTHVKFTLATNK